MYTLFIVSFKSIFKTLSSFRYRNKVKPSYMPVENEYSVSIVLPAYNEEAQLKQTVERIQEWAEVHGESAEIIIVEDGCTDRTPEISAALATAHDNVRHLHFDQRQGKGKAVEHGFADANADILCFMDVDLATDLDSLLSLFEPIQTGSADLTIGSRYLTQSNTDRTVKRNLLSKSYNFLASHILQTGVSDHNCGFKAMRDDVFEQLQNEVEATEWFWDAELLYRAKEHGFEIAEVPITWDEQDHSTITVPTAIADMLQGMTRVTGESLFGDRYPLIQQYITFATIGAVAALINTAILFILTSILEVYYLYSAVIAIETSIIFMFFLNNRFTFEPVKKGFHDIADGLIRSNIIRSVGTGINLALLYVFTDVFGVYYLVSNIAAIFVASIVNFFAEKHFNWVE